MSLKPIRNGELVFLLRQCADLIEEGDLERACWRLADAGAYLRLRLERVRGKGCTPLCGLNEPTGLGALLPSMKPKPTPAIPDPAREP